MNWWQRIFKSQKDPTRIILEKYRAEYKPYIKKYKYFVKISDKAFTDENYDLLLGSLKEIKNILETLTESIDQRFKITERHGRRGEIHKAEYKHIFDMQWEFMLEIKNHCSFIESANKMCNFIGLFQELKSTKYLVEEMVDTFESKTPEDIENFISDETYNNLDEETQTSQNRLLFGQITNALWQKFVYTAGREKFLEYRQILHESGEEAASDYILNWESKRNVADY
ncbi:hypothetical protein ACFL02_09500 [Planctomycetota bacterium]